MKLLAIAALMLVAVYGGLAAAAPHVQVVDPVSQTVFAEQTIDLGVVGPGQRLEVEIQVGTGEMDAVTNKEKDWDKLFVQASSLPSGWKSLDSLRYEKKMKAIVLVSKDASDGTYQFKLNTEDEYEGTPAVYFNAKVRVSHDVFNFDILQDAVKAGVDQPAVYTLRLSNVGSASDAFRIEVGKGLPSSWTYTREIFVPHNSVRDVQYEVVGTDQGEYTVQFKVTSLSSEKIGGEASAGLVVRSSLIEDMKATTRGMLLFPTIEQIVYNLVGLVAVNFF